jgi:hypothetical protein
MVINDTGHNLMPIIRGLFVGGGRNQDVPHVDDSGELRILCPARYNGPVGPHDRLLYKPRLRDDLLRDYAGMDVTAADQDNGTTVFRLDHPLVHFVLHNQHLLHPNDAVFHHDSKTNMFHFDSKYLADTRNFFRNTVLEDMHPTTLADARISCEIPSPLIEELKQKGGRISVFPSLTFTFIVQYLLVTPGEARMKHREIKI